MEARAIVAGTGDYGAVGQREFPGSAPTALGRSAGIIGGSASAMEPAVADTQLELDPRHFRRLVRRSVRRVARGMPIVDRTEGRSACPPRIRCRQSAGG